MYQRSLYIEMVVREKNRPHYIVLRISFHLIVPQCDREELQNLHFSLNLWSFFVPLQNNQHKRYEWDILILLVNKNFKIVDTVIILLFLERIVFLLHITLPITLFVVVVVLLLILYNYSLTIIVTNLIVRIVVNYVLTCLFFSWWINFIWWLASPRNHSPSFPIL